MEQGRNRAERRSKIKAMRFYKGIPYLIFTALAAGYLFGVPSLITTSAIAQASHLTVTVVRKGERLFAPVIAGMIGRTNAGGAAANISIDIYSYTGSYSIIDDGDGNTRVKFLTSGTLILSRSVTVDVFIVGGGGGGAGSQGGSAWCGGGAGGYTGTWSSIYLEAGVSYTITVGAGGTAGPSTGLAGTGGKSWAFNETLYYANGGTGGNSSGTQAGGYGGNGGSGGGDFGGNGGSNGSNGGGTTAPGIGQGTTTREFAESSGDLYAGAGGGGYSATTGGDGGGGARGYAGTTNLGGGGGASIYTGTTKTGFAGGSGIVIVRNHRAA